MRLEAHLVVPGRLDAEITAGPGEVVAVVGPNGAGKSTLVHALAGLLPAAGHARLGETDLLPLPPQRRDVGVVFQDRRLFPHLTAVDNVAFGLRARSRNGRKQPPRASEARAQAQQALDRLGVGHLGDRKPRALSGGQAQRVAIARALVTDPGLLLLDEPFTGLDVGVAAELRIELAQHLAAFTGVTLLVTHDALDALTLATTVVVLDDGRVVQSGPPDEVAARPLTEHVARLVGLNVVRHGEELRAFPPAAVTVSRHRPDGSARNTWSGTVRSAAPHGDAVRLQVATDAQTLLADVTPAATRELALTPGQEVWLAVKETAITRYPTAER